MVIDVQYLFSGSGSMCGCILLLFSISEALAGPGSRSGDICSVPISDFFAGSG